MDISITILELPNGRVGFQVDGGLIFAALTAAERYAANLAAKLARLAQRAAEAVKPVVEAVAKSKPAVAVRLRVAARKAGILADRAKRRSYHAVLDRNSTIFTKGTCSDEQSALAGRLNRLAYAASDRERRLYAALDAHIAARLARTA